MRSMIYCVDLDRTFISQDSTIELLKVAIKKSPKIVFQCALSIYGREWREFKHSLATRENLNSVDWKIRPNIEKELKQVSKEGVLIYLVTASQSEVAEYFYEKFSYFSGYISSDRASTAKGASKFKKMESMFRGLTYEYLGDSIHDVYIWKKLGKGKLPKQKRILFLYLRLFHRNLDVRLI